MSDWAAAGLTGGDSLSRESKSAQEFRCKEPGGKHRCGSASDQSEELGMILEEPHGLRYVRTAFMSRLPECDTDIREYRLTVVLDPGPEAVCSGSQEWE